LGNPGREYAETRHNVGFAVLDQLAKRWQCSFRSRSRFAAELGEYNASAGRIVLAKPQTYMNRSGAAVSALMNWLKIPIGEVLVIVDDADLPLGKIRLRTAGGSGGHNGLRSIIDALGGSEQFARLRVGIGRAEPVGADITGHVLSRFAASEREAAQQAIARAADAVACCVADGYAVAMNKFN
jgi:PTH1 family peptidyl-tRNA hydrolase